MSKLTRIHVNQHNIKTNQKGSPGAKKLPVITVKDYQENRVGSEARVVDKQGNVVCRVIYSPDKPLSCGARVWIETHLDVHVS